MLNLQQLHDFYLKTRPSQGKIQSATKLLIHLCKSLQLDTPEDITIQVFDKVPQAIELYYRSEYHLAVQDKSILAEMIGRYGPRDGFEIILEQLLVDEDANLRQFALQSLEYCARNMPEKVLEYIERYKTSDDESMRFVAASLLCKMYNDKNMDIITKKLNTWKSKADRDFFGDVKYNLEKFINRGEFLATNAVYKQLIKVVDIQLGK